MFTPKKTPTPRKIKVAATGNIQVPPVLNGTFKITDLRLKPRGRTSIYAPAIAKIAKLKKGDAETFAIPKDKTYSVIHNRLVSAIRNAKITAPEGSHFVYRQTEDGTQLALLCEAVKATK